MKIVLTAIFIAFAFIGAYAQQPKSVTQKKVAPFRIQMANGSSYSASELRKDVPVLIVYFDPDCDHCTAFVEDLLKNINAFTDVQIIMVTYVPMQTFKSYAGKMGLNNYPAIKAGTEGTTFIVRYHYDVVQFPYLALHDHTGSLFATFESEVPGAVELAKLFYKK
jgi:peroxiredoxin